MSRRSAVLISGRDRAKYGAIVTFENADGKTISGHRAGPPFTAVRELCAAALELDATYRVVSYSTPSTILGDLDGRLHNVSKGQVEKTTPLPEAFALGGAKLRDMLHPRLRGQSDKTAEKDRTRLSRG